MRSSCQRLTTSKRCLKQSYHDIRSCPKPGRLQKSQTTLSGIKPLSKQNLMLIALPPPLTSLMCTRAERAVLGVFLCCEGVKQSPTVACLRSLVSLRHQMWANLGTMIRISSPVGATGPQRFTKPLSFCLRGHLSTGTRQLPHSRETPREWQELINPPVKTRWSFSVFFLLKLGFNTSWQAFEISQDGRRRYSTTCWM